MTNDDREPDDEREPDLLAELAEDGEVIQRQILPIAREVQRFLEAFRAAKEDASGAWQS